MTPPPAISIVVPAKDEADRIAGSLYRLAGYLATWEGGAEIVVVDDGSTDGTFAVTEELLGHLPVPVRLLRHPENKGKGAALRTGTLRARGLLVGFTDVDLSYAPEVFASFAGAIEKGADVVVGRRTYPVEAPSLLRRAGHAVFATAVRAMLHVPVSDTQCGIKLFRGDVARDLFAVSTVAGFGFDPEILHIAVEWGLEVVEVEAPLTSPSTTSTVRLVTDTPKMLLALLFRVRLRRVPHRPQRRQYHLPPA